MFIHIFRLATVAAALFGFSSFAQTAVQQESIKCAEAYEFVSPDGKITSNLWIFPTGAALRPISFDPTNNVATYENKLASWLYQDIGIVPNYTIKIDYLKNEVTVDAKAVVAATGEEAAKLFQITPIKTRVHSLNFPFAEVKVDQADVWQGKDGVEIKFHDGRPSLFPKMKSYDQAKYGIPRVFNFSLNCYFVDSE